MFLLLNGSSTTFLGKSQSQSSQTTSLWSQFSRSPSSLVRNVSSEWDWGCRNSHLTCTTNQAQRWISAIPYNVQPYHSPQSKQPTANYQIFQVHEEQCFRKEVEEIDMEESLFVTDGRLEKIRHATVNDPSLQALMNIVKEGWPDNKAKIPICIREYWPYRDELSTQNGLAYRGTRIIIPSSMRPEMINRAHASHLGIQYTTGTAREIMYWPRMTTDLSEAVAWCSTCQETQSAQQKEPMMSFPIPQLPW